jgi:hypothetical protein
MTDRVPTYPGRVKMIPVEGEVNTYDMQRADSPVEEGTPLNKASLLQDATAALAGLDNTAVPNDVFAKILTHLLKLQVVVIPGAGWTGTEAPYTQTVNVPYVSADETEQGVFIAPAGASMAEWNRIQALAKEQQTNALLFEAQEKTMEDLTVYVLIQEVL